MKISTDTVSGKIFEKETHGSGERLIIRANDSGFDKIIKEILSPGQYTRFSIAGDIIVTLSKKGETLLLQYAAGWNESKTRKFKR